MGTNHWALIAFHPPSHHIYLLDSLPRTDHTEYHLRINIFKEVLNRAWGNVTDTSIPTWNRLPPTDQLSRLWSIHACLLHLPIHELTPTTLHRAGPSLAITHSPPTGSLDAISSISYSTRTPTSHRNSPPAPRWSTYVKGTTSNHCTNATQTHTKQTKTTGAFDNENCTSTETGLNGGGGGERGRGGEG